MWADFAFDDFRQSGNSLRDWWILLVDGSGHLSDHEFQHASPPPLLRLAFESLAIRRGVAACSLPACSCIPFYTEPIPYFCRFCAALDPNSVASFQSTTSSKTGIHFSRLSRFPIFTSGKEHHPCPTSTSNSTSFFKAKRKPGPITRSIPQSKKH